MFIVILDEISMATAQILAGIDSRIYQATNVQKSFGWIPVIIFRDFTQLLPVKSTHITDVVIKRAKKLTIERIKRNKDDPENN